MRYKYIVYIGNEGEAGYFKGDIKLPNRVVKKLNPEDENMLKCIRNIYLIKDVPREEPTWLKESREKKQKLDKEKKENGNNLHTGKI